MMVTANDQPKVLKNTLEQLLELRVLPVNDGRTAKNIPEVIPQDFVPSSYLLGAALYSPHAPTLYNDRDPSGVPSGLSSPAVAGLPASCIGNPEQQPDAESPRPGPHRWTRRSVPETGTFHCMGRMRLARSYVGLLAGFRCVPGRGATFLPSFVATKFPVSLTDSRQKSL